MRTFNEWIDWYENLEPEDLELPEDLPNSPCDELEWPSD